jgi:hypothetical protein
LALPAISDAYQVFVLPEYNQERASDCTVVQ